GHLESEQSMMISRFKKKEQLKTTEVEGRTATLHATEQGQYARARFREIDHLGFDHRSTLLD
ncbi:hypothetical protein ACLOJK_040222, partial [Asimina triloba]